MSGNEGWDRVREQGADTARRIVAVVRGEAEAATTNRTCTRCGDGNLYPRRCSQCGQRWADGACGPTHALISHELGIADLRATYAELWRAVDDLLRLKDGPRDDAYRAAKDDAWARARSLRDKYLRGTAS